jgi:signal transduction histidine kinase
LRPTVLDDFGLQSALQQLLVNWSARSGVEVDFEAARLGDSRLPSDVETVLYRVVQEALTNVARHANAQHVSVIVERLDDQVIAVVEDDGIGFEVEAVHSGRLGLVGMAERVSLAAGTLDIESSAGGTTIIARIPACRQSN